MKGNLVNRSWLVLLNLIALSSSLLARQAGESAQEEGQAEKGLVYQRKVQLPQGSVLPAIVMTEFLTHGELDARGGNLAVFDGRRNPVPWKVLQAGPGDFCRLAFQTVPKQYLYKIHYGGKTEMEQPPEWTARAGLLLETRHFKPCDFNSFESVSDAFRQAEPYGSGFVPAVAHRFNPFWPDPVPFLSVYRGTMQITRGGKYAFFTSSQDCSFLRVDGKLVVAAPGWHGPVHDARLKGEIELSPGPHEFEYLHGTSGAVACMVAAWQPPGAGKPEVIPPEVFGSAAIARLPAPSVKRPREFAYEIAGEVPLEGSEEPLVRVQFRQVSSRGSASRPRVHWDFGDGRISNLADPVHIYLRPGIYTVAMKAPGETDAQAVVARVPIHRALLFADERQPPDQLAGYLGLLEKDNPAKLDPAGLLQFVRALSQAGQTSRAVKAGQAWIAAGREPSDAGAALDAVRLVGGLLRDAGDDPEAAFTFWQGCVKVLRPEAWKAECELEAADLAMGALGRAEPARPLLDSAAVRLAQGGEPALVGRLNRVWGDWYSRKGDRSSARAAYARAAAALPSRKSAVEQDAWRGALSRSTEEFLRTGAFDRARDELRRWQEEFPVDKLEGYLTFLQARYWAARSRWPQAIALAGDLLAVNPDSPYADRLAFLAAGCEEKLNHPDRARAAYQSMIADYPGSPLVGEARKKLSALSKP
jgi:tetratricopeptide (TPR) repeat protein